MPQQVEDSTTHRINRVTHRDVASNALIKAILAEDAESSCQTSFEVLSLLILVFKLGRSAKW